MSLNTMTTCASPSVTTMLEATSKTFCKLFRFGNKISPRMNIIRPHEIPPLDEVSGEVLPPPYYGIHEKKKSFHDVILINYQQTENWKLFEFPGVSTWNIPVFTTDSVWAYEKGSVIPEGLSVIQDAIFVYGERDGVNIQAHHWSWVPRKAMSLKTYMEVCTLSFF